MRGSVNRNAGKAREETIAEETGFASEDGLLVQASGNINELLSANLDHESEVNPIAIFGLQSYPSELIVGPGRAP